MKPVYGGLSKGAYHVVFGLQILCSRTPINFASSKLLCACECIVACSREMQEQEEELGEMYERRLENYRKSVKKESRKRRRLNKDGECKVIHTQVRVA